jgi:hypothetical protein
LATEFEIAHQNMIERIEPAGWSFSGSYYETILHGSFGRQLGRLGSGPTELVEKIPIVTEPIVCVSGGASGIRLGRDCGEDTGGICILYNSYRSQGIEAITDGLVSWGEELDARQADAATSELHVSEAESVIESIVAEVETTDEQINRSSVLKLLVKEKGMSRTRLAETYAEGATLEIAAGQDPAVVIPYLETTFALAAQRLLELKPDEIGDRPYIRDSLAAIGREVQWQIVERREERAALTGKSMMDLLTGTGQRPSYP